MRTRLLAALALGAAALTGCGGGNGNDPLSSAPVTTAPEVTTTPPAADEPQVSIVGSGFGQSDSAVTGIVLATTSEEDLVGSSVTITVNFLAADGSIIATEEQTESFSWAGQQLAFPVFLYLGDQPPGTKVDRIDPAVSIGDGLDEDPRDPLPILDATAITKAAYGTGYKVSFEFTNQTEEALDDLRVGAVCYDAGGTILGGDSTYPEVAPVGRTIRIDLDDLTLAAKPATCKAYLNYPA